MQFTLNLRMGLIMAEFLVYLGPHWMDIPGQYIPPDDSNPKEKRKYEARLQLGDICEVYEDGRCKEKPHPNCKYCIIKIPGLIISSVKHLNEPIVDIDSESITPSPPVLRRRRRWFVNIESLSPNIRNAIYKDKIITLTNVQFNTVLTEKVL